MRKILKMRQRRPLLIILALAFTLLCGSSLAGPSLIKKPFRVVLDPGHGGVDHGTRGGGVSEKQITLNLANATAAALRKKGFSVILTREKDQDLPLAIRTSLANRVGAQVFISIHLNSEVAHAGNGGGHGPETYILNNTSDASSKRLATLENSVLEPEQRKGGAQTDVALILKDLQLDANLGMSKRLACAVQTELLKSHNGAAAGGSKNRGVKQGLFYVLLGADMPSILVEAGFLSHPKDRAFLTSPRGVSTFAESLTRALEHFRDAKDDPKLSGALEAHCEIK